MNEITKEYAHAIIWIALFLTLLGGCWIEHVEEKKIWIENGFIQCPDDKGIYRWVKEESCKETP